MIVALLIEQGTGLLLDSPGSDKYVKGSKLGLFLKKNPGDRGTGRIMELLVSI